MYHKLINFAQGMCYDKYQNQSVNKKIWDLIQDEMGKSEGRYEFITLQWKTNI